MIKLFLSGIWKFIQSVQKIVGTIFFIFIVFLFFLYLTEDTTPDVPNGAALIINPEGFVVEQLSEKNALDIIVGAERNIPPETLLRDIIRAIKVAQHDSRIKILILRLDYINPMGASKAHYIAKAIDDFKTSGKKVYAYGVGYSQSNYLIAAHADEVYMHPEGSIILSGYGIYPTYYKGALEKIGAKINVFKVGDYKSAVEPYIRDNMSLEAKIANQTLLNKLWGAWVNDVTTQRGLEKGTIENSFASLQEDLRKLGGDMGLYTKSLNLIDGLFTQNEWKNYIQNIVGSANSGSYKNIGIRNYLISNPEQTSRFGDEIAIIVASGTIMAGEQPSGVVGGDTIARHIRAARFDKDVKALVLRVDSPGGSLIGSEVIREEVDLAKEAGKPVIVSMGSLAASGGYWISATASEVWASPTTITGSIGIFALIPTFADTIAKIGVVVDGVGTTPLSGGFNLGLGLNEATKGILQQSISNGYRDFVTLVSKGRNLSFDVVEGLAQGRVWDGQSALQKGLIDKLGTLDDAIKSAAHLSGLLDYNVRYVEDTPSFEKKLAQFFFGSTLVQENIPKQSYFGPTKLFLTKLIENTKTLTSLNDPMGLYVLCPDCIVEQGIR